MSHPPYPSQLFNMSAEVGQLLTKRGLTIALAESCTGGLLASVLTDVAGSSNYVLAGVVSYSNEAKTEILSIERMVINEFGAVSAETAMQMAVGVRRLLGADLGVSVTGIAGPGGGTTEKPVGLVYLHLSAKGAEWGEHHIWPYDRIGNKQASVGASLALILRYFNTSITA